MKTLTLLCSVMHAGGCGVIRQSGWRLLRLCRQLHESDGPTTTSAAKGIYGFRFDSKTGTLSPLGLVAETVNPAHVWAHPNGKFLYASNWETGMPGDYLTAYSIDHHTGKLTLINKVGAKGDRANQVVLDPSGKFAATVTYNSGTFSAVRCGT